MAEYKQVKQSGESTQQAITQKKAPERSGAVLQDNRPSSSAFPVQRKPNNTGLPDNLKSGMESVSGMSLDHVKVHYNSPKPATVQAHAYAQGSDIHLASGQEKHLPHELGHVVQQMQGKVQATTTVGGIAVNDNPGLEKEADVMGAKALQMKNTETDFNYQELLKSAGSSVVFQRVRGHKPKEGADADPIAKRRKKNIFRNATDNTDLFGVIRKFVPDIVLYKIGRSKRVLNSAMHFYFYMKLSEDLIENPRAIKNNDADEEAPDELLVQYRNELDVLKLELENAVSEFSSSIKNRTTPSEQEDRSPQGRRLRTQFYSLGSKAERTWKRIKMSFDNGTFSAVGRAHSIPEGDEVDNSYLNNFSLTVGEAEVHHDSTSRKAARRNIHERAGDTRIIMGKTLEEWLEEGESEEAILATLEGKLNQAISQDASFIDTPTKMPRGSGQRNAMKNTNATGYAQLIGIPGWANQRWEWLHIRGASLGGETNSSNLVVGTRDSNTHMMPFESNIRALGTMVGQNRQHLGPLSVYWDLHRGETHHCYRNISIRWRLRYNLGQDNQQNYRGHAQFNPLNTSSNISKAEVSYIEDTLREVRTGLIDQRDNANEEGGNMNTGSDDQPQP